MICLAVLMAPVCSAHAGRQSTKALDELAAVLPTQMRAAVLVTNLDRSSDSLVTLLEGMDRANLLIGSRPSDQIKSTLQLSVAVNDLGGGGVVFVPVESANRNHDDDGGDSNKPPRTLASVGVVPVTSVRQFLSGNFTVTEDQLNGVRDDLVNGAQLFSHPLMGDVHLRRINNHVIFSRVRSAVETYEAFGESRDADKRSVEPLRDRFGRDAWQAMAEGHVVAYSEQDALGDLTSWARQTLDQRKDASNTNLLRSLLQVLARNSDSPSLAKLVHAGRDGVIVLEFDPLGLFVRTHWNLDSQSELARFAEGDGRSSATVSPLPADSYYVAASCDAGLFRAITPRQSTDPARSDPWRHVREALNKAKTLHVLASPHPAGFGEAMLANTAVVIETDHPTEVREAIRRDVKAMGSALEPNAVEATWQERVAVTDSIQAASFRVHMRGDQPDRAAQRVLRQYLFGPGERTGYVWHDESTVVVTTAKRADTLVKIINAQQDRRRTLDDDPVVTTMRNWMPEDRAVELYIQPDEVLRALRHTPLGFAMPEPLRARLNSDLTPIGFSAEVSRSAARTITIIPADTLTLVLDTVRRPPGAAVPREQPGQRK